jgi:alpha-L-rhamnosidase
MRSLHTRACIRLFSLLVSFSFASNLFAGMPEIVAMKCEYLVNPIGVDAQYPRLSWQLKDERRGAAQTAYQIIVSTHPTDLSKELAWQSGKINGTPNLVRYKGRKLKPFTRYYWKLEIWDKDGKKIISPISFFETGLMDMKNWKGAWISDLSDVNVKPAGNFRKEFEAPKKVRSARAYIAAAGLYELYINGNKIGNHRLDPMYTRFDRRTLYVSYDVTAALLNGRNAVGVTMGNGWYNHQSTAVWNFHNAPWRARPAFCLDLRITYEDGSIETVSSGKDWKTALGPIIFNSIYTAEHYDARLEQQGWKNPGFDDKKWKNVIYRAAPSQNIVSQLMHPVENVERIEVKEMKKLADTLYLFDLGRNISGVCELNVQGEAGAVIRLKHAEQLDSTGRADQSNIDVHYRPTDNTDPFQTDIFILSGKGRENFMPKFNYKGFQYVEVSCNRPLQLNKEDLVGYFMHSSTPVAGKISSSNEMINKLWAATNASYLSNLFGYPTDCPQREKNGWTGDAHIASETGLYGFDGITIYEKWLADHRDEQQPNGVLPSIIPTGGWGYEWGNGPDWTSTIAIIPWNIYLFYGDTTLLADSYTAIKKYVDHINELYPSGLTTWGLGDWVPVKSKTPVELSSTAYYFTDVTIFSKAAALLGKTEDHKKYTALAEKIRKAFNDKYLDTQKGIYGSGVQTELSVPLMWGLVPEQYRSKVAGNLAKRVAEDSFHLDVGLLGTKAILNALSENGYADIAYKIAAQETFPSWGWWIRNGATTLYENWPINAKSDISRNHIMFGEIGAWLYKGPGGIKPDETKPGFRNIILEPHFVEGIEHFEALHEGPYGTIVSSWKRNGGSIIYTVIVPANSTASLKLDKAVYENGKALPYSGSATKKIYRLAAGKYVLEIR